MAYDCSFISIFIGKHQLRLDFKLFSVELWLQRKKLVYLEQSKNIQNNHVMVVERHDVVDQL